MRMFSDKQIRELLGLALFALALFTGLSLIPPEALARLGVRSYQAGNLMGVAGAHLSDVAYVLLGAGAPLVPLIPLLGGIVAFGWVGRGRAVRHAVLLVSALILVPTAFGLFLPEGTPIIVRGRAIFPTGLAGWLGESLGSPLRTMLGLAGGTLLLLFLVFALPLVTIGWNPARTLGRGASRGVGALRRTVSRRATAVAVATETSGTAGAGPAEDGAAVLTDAEGAEAGGAQAADLVGHGEANGTGPLPWDGAAPSKGEATVDDDDGTGSTGSVGRRRKRRKPSLRGLARLGGRRASDAEAAGEESAAELELEDTGDPSSADRPPLRLLSSPPERDEVLSAQQLDRLGQVLIDTLGTFKVEGRVAGRTTGPVVTQFEVVPAPGIKVSRIANLDADLALALKAPSIRIVAPIPGKGAVGVEVPNPTPEIVYLREILSASPFRRSRDLMPLALGRDLTGKPHVSDLSRMPHLLIAGATGSGKSVCINTIITSLIYRHSPQELRLLMIDPKMVELSMYSDLPHLRHPVVTDPSDAAVVLKWAVLEMERRYALLSANGARSLDEFNRRVAEGRPMKVPEADGEEGDPDRWLYKDGPLPYIVVIVDELADLMMAVQAEVERPLAQLAQKARAIGIHLIVATQRPSVNVITGLIKANFPCRIAFRVSSKVDSRTILDQNGADALLGNGDMLFLPPGTSDPVRIQGAYLATEDTERLMAWYRERKDGAAWEAPGGEEDILEVVRSHEADAADEALESVDEERDVLFRQAAETCVQYQQGSTSLLQRRLRIGYGRAARIIDQLHNAGVLGPPDGPKAREVLVGPESIDHICGED